MTDTEVAGRILVYASTERASVDVGEIVASIGAGSNRGGTATDSPLPVVILDPRDPFLALHPGPPPLLLVADLEGDPTMALALCRILRARFPATAIVGLIGENRLAAGLALREARLDAILPAAFDRSSLAALIERHLELARERLAYEGLRTRTIAAQAEAKSEALEVDPLRVFVRSVAHEVNNPLTTIRGLLQLLQHDGGRLSQDELSGALETMDGESRRISEIVTELEYFGGARKPVRTPVRIGIVVREALDSVALHAVHAREVGTIPEALLDREQVYLALRHLFGSLAARGGTSPAIDVTIAASAGRLDVSISGAIDRQVATSPSAFVPLNAARIANGERRSLACAFGIARAHGGNLHVETGSDGGPVVRLELPCAGTPEPIGRPNGLRGSESSTRTA